MIENNKVIIWGLKGVNNTMRFVNDAFFLAFKYMGYNVYWVNSIEELNIKNVYVSTDCTNKEDLEYIHNNLPTFQFPDINNFENVDLAIIESIICSSSDFFIGTSHSLYTSNIIGERNKLNINESKSIIFDKD